MNPNIPNFKILTKTTVYSESYDSDEEHEKFANKLYKEQIAKEEELGLVNDIDTEYKIHFFDSMFANECIEIMSLEEAIQCLAIKDGVDIVEYSNGNVGYIAYYNMHIDGFEILGKE